MNTNWRKRFTRPRSWLLALLGLIILGGAGYGINTAITRYRLNQPGVMIDIPVVNTDSGPQGGVVTETAISGSGSSASAARAQLLFRLSQGQEVQQTGPAISIVTGEPLTAEQIQQILDRLPALEAEEGDQVDFNLPDELIPPPRPGATVDEPFPPPAPEVAPEEVPSGPLEVLRYSPEGEIPLAPFLNVTFNQPMVALTTQEALLSVDVPVKITPELPGTWVWLGTKTLSFEYDATAVDRLPMATDYTVEIPAGTQSATGGELAQTVSWTFSTPPVQLERSYPSGSSVGLDPLFFAAFDQLIDPQAVLNTIQVTADGQSVAVQLVSEADIAADETVSRLVKNAGDGRTLVFRAQQALPTDASINVTIGPGTPSAEGPRTTTEPQTFSFQTYAPLKIVDHGCSWYDDECPPLTPFYIQFNNPIDPEVYTESMLQISPDLAGASVNIQGNGIQISGMTQGRTTYRVRVSGDIQDVFGQTLGENELLTFKVGSAPEFLSGPDSQFITLDPSASKPVFTVYSINYDKLNVRAYAVQPSDWRAYRDYLDRQWEENPPSPPGRKVLDDTITVDGQEDALTETAVDLTQTLNGQFGHLIVIVEPPSGLLSGDRYDYQKVQAWVQVTQIGLDAFTDHSQMVVWANALQDGAPLSGVTVQLEPNGGQATTGSDGTARLDLGGGATYLVARQGDDVAMLPNSPYYWDDYSWRANPPSDELRWYVFDDRQMYRPGEEVHVKGWIRQIGNKQGGDVGLFGGSGTSIAYTVMGPQGNELLTGQAQLNALGGFDLVFTLPDNTNLGYATLQLLAQGSGLNGRDYYHSFQIQEFRRPEFEVTARNETTGPYFVSDHAVVATTANYYAGGPLPNAEVTWNVTSSPSSYAPPNWSGFTFGTWTPWWWFDYGYGMEADYFGGSSFGDETIYETFSGTTDANGEHFLRLDFDEITAPRPFSILAEATVMDVNRQAWTAGTTLLVHPSDLYVGIRSQRTFVERGDPMEIEAIVTDLDGNAIAGKTVKMTAARQEWKYRQGSWGEESVDVQECIVTSANEPVVCTFDTEKGGSYLITAVITDDQGRENQSQFTRWVSGGQRPPARNVEQESVSLIPDKESYQPGDTAEILVLAPFSPAEGLLTVARSGILYTERFQMTESSYTLRVPIADGHIPNLNVQVDLVGESPRTGDDGEPIEGVPPRPAYATGMLNLSVPPHSRTLAVEAAPQDSKLEPGGQTVVDVTVQDSNGRPVADAELAVVVVDEAILALSNYQLADPLAVFYNNRHAWLNSYYSRANIVLANPQALSDQVKGAVERQAFATADTVMESELMVEAPMAAEPAMEEAAADMAYGLAAGGEAAAQPIQVRSNFDPLATFAPTVHTDSDGRAQVEVQLPDNLTRYRIMVVAVAGGKQFGTAESNLTARLPLMVRPSAPRFLNFGDQFELPIVVQNQTDQPMEVQVVAQVSNLELTAGAGQSVTVPANDRVEVRFPATTFDPGTARIQVAAVSGSFADAATIELPVYTPATTEAFATYGVIDEGAVAQPVAVPDNVFQQFGGLEINTSSTALQALTDAVLYLTTYRFECSEQTASRIMAIAALRDVLTAFEADGLPSPAEMEASVTSGIEKLQGMQNYDGGFPVWKWGDESIPYHSIYVAHALTMARTKGFDVPEQMMQQSLTYLRNIESYYPHYYGEQIRRSLSAYALYVRQLMGDTDPAKAQKLYNEIPLDEWPLEPLAWLWPVLSDSAESADIYRHLQNRAVETASAANFTTSYGDEAYLMLHSDRRTDGLILDALIRIQPDSDLIPKVVNGLLAHRTAGRWGNTQENTFILLALDRYFNTFEAETPDFVARIWLGDTYAGDHAFEGRTTERHQTDIPMSYLFDVAPGETAQDLILSKDGPGRLYYRLGLKYAPTDLSLDALDRGFIVQRTYEALDDPEDVYQDEQGIWHIKAGARVRVSLTMVANNRRYHVALVDPLPAGLEIVNPALAVSGDVPSDPGQQPSPYSWWWWWNWYQHQNMRDERAEAFTTLLWEGVYDYSYVARATTPGTFVVPPAKAEEMYSPEVFGRSASDFVIVE